MKHRNIYLLIILGVVGLVADGKFIFAATADSSSLGQTTYAPQVQSEVTSGYSALNEQWTGNYINLPLCSDATSKNCKDINGLGGTNDCVEACRVMLSGNAYGKADRNGVPALKTTYASAICPDNYTAVGVVNEGQWFDRDGPYEFVTYEQLVFFLQNGYQCTDMTIDVPMNAHYTSTSEPFASSDPFKPTGASLYSEKGGYTELGPYCHGSGIWSSNQKAIPGSYVSESVSFGNGYPVIHVTGREPLSDLEDWGNYSAYKQGNLCGYYQQCYRPAGYYIQAFYGNVAVQIWSPHTKEYLICTFNQSIWKSPTSAPSGCPPGGCNW